MVRARVRALRASVHACVYDLFRNNSGAQCRRSSRGIKLHLPVDCRVEQRFGFFQVLTSDSGYLDASFASAFETVTGKVIGIQKGTGRKSRVETETDIENEIGVETECGTELGNFHERTSLQPRYDSAAVISVADRAQSMHGYRAGVSARGRSSRARSAPERAARLAVPPARAAFAATQLRE
ncbi:hypothetical protein EVAR_66423_1 [Eumeta japonica]|uniref:Uncharacterized protein n=1 Tax=Eumeta variegata TaxID=151549 RepID=A0A4C1ZWA7_EUMVA|nr:hypothetical protein EVAR_66423_1 [Eumeta japonica]